MTALALFTCPRAFEGHFAVVQRNAIASWTMLEPRPRVLLVGDEPGVAEAAGELGVEHHPPVARSETGLPLLSDAFATAERLAPAGLLCWINADIVLLSDFAAAVARLPAPEARPVMVGRRVDLDVEGPIDPAPGWEERLRERAAREGVPHPPWGIDYVVFPSGLLGPLPPFAVGRAAYDAWILHRALAAGATVVDASAVVTALHQNHDYPGGGRSPAARNRDAESARNRELAGWWAGFFDLRDATHVLTERGLEPAAGARRRLRRAYARLGSVSLLRPALRLALELRRSWARRSRARPGPARTP